jgi:hypothetical protein
VRPFPALMIIPAVMIVLPAQETKPPAGKMTDADIEAFAKQALTLQDTVEQREALNKIQGYRFKSSRIKEREFVLYAEGILEDRLGNTPRAAITLRKLEVAFPQSPYLNQVQTILATSSIEHKRYPDAEKRLWKALDSDIPVESKRRTQELLLWVLAEQKRWTVGIPIVKTLQPLGSAKPSERGLVAILEVLCLNGDKDQAASTRKDLQTLYPNSRYTSRADLAWARLLGTTGDPAGSADVFRRIITTNGDSPEADEARLALISLLSEGKLRPKEAEGYPTPEKLLAELRKNDRKGDKTRKTLLLELRLHVNKAQWKKALDSADKLKEAGISPEEMAEAGNLRNTALQSWARQQLDSKNIEPLLPYLDEPGISALTAEQRTTLVGVLVQKGLADAAHTVIQIAPAKEKPGLLKVAAETTSADSDPETVLKMLPAKGETPVQSLRRAQALIALKRWSDAKTALGRAQPGPDRVAALVTYLQRPVEMNENSTGRLKEAEGWLAKLAEKGPDREALSILVADLRAKGGDWKGALALYPADPQKASRGWVALMRATCQVKLNLRNDAKITLKIAVNEPDFKMERATLGKQLGM